MSLFRLISWPYFRRHVLRTLLTTAGIVLGVAVFVGMHAANQSVLFAFSRTVDRIAGKTELQVTAAETGFPEEVLDTVQSAASVRVAVPVIEAVVDTNLKGQGSLLVLGIDMTGDRSLRDYDLESGDDAVVDDPLVLLAQPDSIMGVNISSAFALFIGMFIIYNSFSIAVTQRRSEIGILRALGATRRQIRWLFLGESAVTGLIGSIGGVAFGVLIAHAIAASIGTLIADVYGVAQRTDEIARTPGLLAIAVAIGVTTSMVAAAIPAMNAARVDPVQALQKGKYQVLSAGESRLRAILALVLGLVSVVCLTTAGSRPVFYVGYFLAIVVALLLSPLLALTLARALRPMLKWVRPVEGALAADSLIQSPRRTSASVAALMLSLALVVAFAGMARASYDSIIDWMNATLNPDLFVLPSPNIVVRTIRFPPAMAGQLAAIPGIRRVQMVRDARVVFRRTPVMVVAVEMKSVAETVTRMPVEGDPDEMYRRAAAAEGLIVSDNLAELQHLRVGDTLEVPAPNGVLRLPLVGIVVDYSDQQGTILMDRSLFVRYWNDDTVNIFRLYVTPGAHVSDVRQRILETFAGQRHVFVLPTGDLK